MAREPSGSGRLARALAAIDAANADDPRSVRVGGSERPREIDQAERVSRWVARLRPDASEALQLAARAHHVRRWEIPRDRYPSGRRGSHRWRLALHDHHAELVGRILGEQGYDAAEVARVQDLVRKRDLASDPDVQALEDALCLVFLETELAALSARLEEARLLDVLRRTLAKMSPGAVEEARKLADPAAREWLRRATSE